MMPRATQDEDLTYSTRRGPCNDIERRERLEDVGEHHDWHDQFGNSGIDHDEDAEAHQQERSEIAQRGIIVPMRTANKGLEVTDFAAAAASSRFQDELLLLSPPTSSIFSLSPPSDSSKLPNFSPGTGSTIISSNHRSRHHLGSSSSKERYRDDDTWASRYSSGHPLQHAEIDPTLLHEHKQQKPMLSAPEALLQLVELSSLSDDDRSHHGQAAFLVNHPQPHSQTDAAKSNQRSIDLMYRSANFEEATSGNISIRRATATAMSKRRRDASSKETAPTAARIRRFSQHYDHVLNQHHDGTKNFLGKEETKYGSSLPGGSSAEDDASKAIQEIEHSYAGFDAYPSSTFLSELGDHTVHNASAASTYMTEGEEAHDRRVYNMDANQAEGSTEPSNKVAKAAVSPPTQEEEPGHEQYQGVASRRTRTTKRAARQLGSKKDHDDHVISSSGGKKVLQHTLKDDQKDDAGSEEIAERQATRKIAQQNVDQWNTRLQELQEYKAQHGHCNVPFCYNDKPFLAAWVKRQRYQYKCKVRRKHSQLTDEREALLEQLGFVWDTHVAAWEENFALMVEFYRQHGHCYVPIKQKELSTWAKRQRRHYKQYQHQRQHQHQQQQQETSLQGPTVSSTIMTEDRIRRLNEIEFPWTTAARPSSKVVSLHKAGASSFGNSSSSATSQDELASKSTPTSRTKNDNHAVTPGDNEEPLRTVPVETTNDMAESIRTSSPISETVTRAVRRSVRQRSKGDNVHEGT